MNKKGHKKIKKRRLRIKVVLKTLLFLAIVGALYFYITNLDTKNMATSPISTYMICLLMYKYPLPGSWDIEYA